MTALAGWHAMSLHSEQHIGVSVSQDKHTMKSNKNELDVIMMQQSSCYCMCDELCLVYRTGLYSADSHFQQELLRLLGPSNQDSAKSFYLSFSYCKNSESPRVWLKPR